MSIHPTATAPAPDEEKAVQATAPPPDVTRPGTARHGTVQMDVTQPGTARHGTVQIDVTQPGTARHGTVQIDAPHAEPSRSGLPDHPGLPGPSLPDHPCLPDPSLPDPGLPDPSLPDAKAVRRILVCQLRQIGDVLLSTPAIELLARHYPGADIHVLTEKKCLPMLENNPHIHRLWPLDKEALSGPFKEIAFYRRLGGQGFDLAVDFQQLPRCRAAVFWSRAATRLSFPPPWYLRWLYTHWHQGPASYAAAYKASVLTPLGIVWNGERPRLYLTDEERRQAAALLQNLGVTPGRFISLDVTHRHPTRRWPAGHYAALLDMLARALPDWKFFLPFAPGEEDYIRELANGCAEKDRIALPGEPLSLRQLAACMEGAALQLGNCSSPRHMAVALDVPSLTILGSTSNGWTFPSPEHAGLMARDLMPMPCQPCNKNACPNAYACLTQLAPEMVFGRVMDHLRLTGAL